MTKHYLDIQEKVIDGITKYYYYDEAQLVVGYFDTEEEAVKDREEYDKYLMSLLQSAKSVNVLNDNETSSFDL